MFNQKAFCRPGPINSTNSSNKWILCRSTSMLPGKYYWFNRHTGEAAWSDENGNPQLQMPTQPNKYNYQEPSSPPFNTSPNPSNTNPFAFPPNYQFNNYPHPKQMINQSYHQSIPQQSIPNQRLTPPGLSQTSFQKYFPEPQMTNERASQQLYVQTSFNQPIISKDFTFSEMIRKGNDLKRKRDQMTQTLGDNSYSVHSTAQPLHKRFLNTTKFDSELSRQNYQNLSESLEIPAKRNRVTLNNNNENDKLNNNSHNIFNQKYTLNEENKQKLTHKEIWTTKNLCKEINKISDDDSQRNISKNTASRVDKETNTDSKIQKSMFSPIHEDVTQNKEVHVTETSENIPSNLLDKDDLRLRLLERKNRLEHRTKEENDSKQSTFVSNKKPLESVKKRVRFRDDHFITNDDDDQQVGDENYDGCGFYEDREPSHEVFTDDFEDVSYIKINIGRLKNLSTCPVKDVWYIAVDLPSLIADYEFLIKLVYSDTACTLLIPEEVKRTLDSQCKGSCLGRRDVMLVRHVSRDLARRRDKICLQNTLEKKKMEISKNILKCCTEKANRGYYVILITMDAELRRKCKPYDIPTFTIENIKEFVTEHDQNKPRTTPKTVAFKNTIQNSNATVPNSKSNGNIFLDKIYPQSFLESFHNNKNNNIVSSAADTKAKKDFSLKKTFSNEKTTFLPKNNDGTLFKIPKISKQSERRFDLETEIEDKLKRFTPSSNAVEQRFEVAKDSWLCSFGQIVEDGLTYILRLNEAAKAYPPPWTFLDSIKCVKLIICEEANVLTRLVVDKLLHIVYDFTVKDFINPNIRFEDFLTIFGLTYLLFEAFKERPLYSNIPSETLANLDEMFVSLNDVTSQPDDAIFDNKIPTVSIDICTDLVRDEGNKVIKKDEEVLEYLRRHYSQFKNENITLGNDNENIILRNDNELDKKKVFNETSINIIRTLGRDLGKITFSTNNNTKTIVMQKFIEKLDGNTNENDNPKNDIDDYHKGNTFDINNDKSKTKIVRKISVIQDFEERIMKNKLYDYQNDKKIIRNKTDLIRNEIDDYDDCKKQNFSITNEFIQENENFRNENDTGVNDIDIDDLSNARLSNVMTSDSGIVKSNESLYAQTVVEIFLSEIKSFFYAIFNFINKSTSIIKTGELSLKKQQKLVKKISIADAGIRSLITRIQSIIEREAAGTENSFKILLVKSGVDPDNVKTYRYRQVLIKCLEQIRILGNGLNILEAVARNEEVATAEIHNISANIGTYNIFSD